MRARGVVGAEVVQRQILVVLVAAVACGEGAAPARLVPASLETVSALATGGTVGAPAGPWVVKVKDAKGLPLPGVSVVFAATLGGGSPSPRTDTSDADGNVSATLIAGTVPGQNQLSATVAGIAPAKSLVLNTVSGPVSKVVIPFAPLRFSATRTSIFINALTRDAYGNASGPNATWQSRNPALVTVNPGNGNNANVLVASRPGQTYVVASVGSAVDSILVSVLDAASSPCAFAVPPTTLAIGETATFAGSDHFCVRAETPGAEYAVVTHYSAASSTALVNAELLGIGITAPATAWPAEAGNAPAAAALESPMGQPFESRLRDRERVELAERAAGARAWFTARTGASLTAPLREGDLASVNVNSSDFCIRPDFRSMRVAAITNTAVILADTENPTGGFTDEEYRALGLAMDTLVYPVDTAAFGVPTDIDGNNRVVIAFTSAVNALTPRGSPGGVALGFFFSRDLLPKESASGECAGSNVSEMFYVLVPDPTGIASDPRSKTFVQTVAVSTIAHEFQHLINTSRRLYVNRNAAVVEELWLNEGLSHVAEELIFYRASGLSPRQNISGAQLQPGSGARLMFDTFMRGNFARYQSYLRSPELNSPISTEDFLATRGATWAFLRYVADRAGSSDGTLWRRLANSVKVGLVNLDAELAGTGLTALGLLRDWSVSVFTDDAIPSGSPPAQPSWDFVTGLPAVGLAFGLAPAVLPSDLTFGITIRAGGSSYARFAVQESHEALLQVRGTTGTALPAGTRVTVVRTR